MMQLSAANLAKRLMVRSLDVDAKEITWEFAEDALDYTFQVYRSESPSGPFEAVSPEFSDRFIFVDRRIPIGAKYVVLHYKLRIRRILDGYTVETDPVSQSAEADLVAQNIRRVQMTYFTQVVGRRVWLFKKRAFGPRCKTCWDSTFQKRTVDRCLDCFGTGVLRGYHNPIEIWMQIDPSTKMQQNNAQQIAELVSTAGRTSFYPNISPGDIVVELENKRWRVQSVTLSERLRAPIKQELVMRQIEERDIEFKIPVRLEVALRDVHPSPNRLFNNSTDINTAIDNRLGEAVESFMTYSPNPRCDRE